MSRLRLALGALLPTCLPSAFPFPWHLQAGPSRLHHSLPLACALHCHSALTPFLSPSCQPLSEPSAGSTPLSPAGMDSGKPPALESSHQEATHHPTLSTTVPVTWPPPLCPSLQPTLCPVLTVLTPVLSHPRVSTKSLQTASPEQPPNRICLLDIQPSHCPHWTASLWGQRSSLGSQPGPCS